MMSERESAGYQLGETAHLLRVNVGIALAAVIVTTAVGVATDLYPDYAGVASLVSLVVNLVLQYETTSALLVHYELIEGRPRRRRLWALLGLNIISGMGIMVGLIAFIIPGTYLFVRWSAAVPALIAEEADITDSLRLSAEAVEERFWHVFASILVVWMPFVVGASASALVPEDQRLIGSLLLNLSLNLSLIAGWHLAVAVYAGRQDRSRLAEVFA